MQQQQQMQKQSAVAAALAEGTTNLAADSKTRTPHHECRCHSCTWAWCAHGADAHHLLCSRGPNSSTTSGFCKPALPSPLPPPPAVAAAALLLLPGP